MLLIGSAMIAPHAKIVAAFDFDHLHVDPQRPRASSSTARDLPRRLMSHEISASAKSRAPSVDHELRCHPRQPGSVIGRCVPSATTVSVRTGSSFTSVVIVTPPSQA